MFIREDWMLFRTMDTLSQKAGVPKNKIPALVAKELTDNALDNSGICRIGLLSDNGFYVEDDGDGIDPELLPKLFSINRPMMSTKLLRMPTRGALGNGLRVVTGAVIATGGTLKVYTRGRIYMIVPKDDGSSMVEIVGIHVMQSTRIEVRLGVGKIDVTNLSWSKRAILLAGGEIYKGKTSPYWYTSEAFYELIQADQSGRSAREFVSLFDGCTGGKAGEISFSNKNRILSSLTFIEAELLLQSMREYAKLVKPDRLGAVGITLELDSLHYTKVTGTFVLPSTRGMIHAEIPIVVEAWAKPNATTTLFAHVNRTPITGDLNYYTSKNMLTVFGCGLYSSLKVPIGKNDFQIWLNIITPYMPITTDGKEPDFSLIGNYIFEAIEKSVSKAKRNILATIVGRTKSQKEILLERLDYATNKASGEGKYRFSLRQLFYVLRSFIISELGKEPEYDYFSKVITDYEADEGDINGLYRDPRGILYHPHLGQEIPLGTIAVEKYHRPEWTFNKILYSEKEGFFSILKSVGWPEKHDCALLTSKGFASRAVRDVLDLLGETNEELQFFCIHDADASGTMIYQSLQEGTKARPGRKVRITNFGLEPKEALNMGLEVEKVNHKGKSPVANYVSESWKEWLQSNRIELNSMSTPQFIKWLDTKMEARGHGRLIPPQEVLINKLHNDIKEGLRKDISSKILDEAGLEEQIDEAYEQLTNELINSEHDLTTYVNQELQQEPINSWRKPVEQMAMEVIKHRI